MSSTIPSTDLPAVPLWLKVAYTVWFFVWVWAYWDDPGPQNFFWICDVANFVIVAALWRESSLLTSSQAVSILLIQIVWTLDFTTRLLFGFHLLGATQYMFDPQTPWYRRSMSLFHVWMPLLVLWLLPRLGYHRQAFRFQTLIAWMVLPLSYLMTDPGRNINWVHAPFGREVPGLTGWGIPLLYMALVPLVIYWPTHWALSVWATRSERLDLVP